MLNRFNMFCERFAEFVVKVIYGSYSLKGYNHLYHLGGHIANVLVVLGIISLICCIREERTSNRVPNYTLVFVALVYVEMYCWFILG